jgi:hypothetical protein
MRGAAWLRRDLGSPDGTRNVLGLAHVSVPPAIAPAAIGADWIRVRNIGLAFSRTPLGNALDIGYSDNTLAGIHQHSCVRIEQPFTLSGEDYASSQQTR